MNSAADQPARRWAGAYDPTPRRPSGNAQDRRRALRAAARLQTAMVAEFAKLAEIVIADSEQDHEFCLWALALLNGGACKDS
jgi:hypothetical protein